MGLGGDDIAQDGAAGGDDGGGRFVACRFDAEDSRHTPI
jgi:hypothetical protein